MSVCKKHGKERDRIVKSRPSSRGGGAAIFEYVGCEDCAAEKQSSKPPDPKPPAAKPPAAKPPDPKPPEKRGSIGHRFGFKF